MCNGNSVRRQIHYIETRPNFISFSLKVVKANVYLSPKKYWWYWNWGSDLWWTLPKALFSASAILRVISVENNYYYQWSISLGHPYFFWFSPITFLLNCFIKSTRKKWLFPHAVLFKLTLPQAGYLAFHIFGKQVCCYGWVQDQSGRTHDLLIMRRVLYLCAEIATASRRKWPEAEKWVHRWSSWSFRLEFRGTWPRRRSTTRRPSTRWRRCRRSGWSRVHSHRLEKNSFFHYLFCKQHSYFCTATDTPAKIFSST